MWDEWLANSKLVRPPGGALWMSRELLTAQPWCARFLYNVHCNVLQFRGLFSHLNTIHFFFHLPETESLKEISIIRAIRLFCILFCCHRQNMEKLYSLNPPQKNSFVLWYIYLLFFLNMEAFTHLIQQVKYLIWSTLFITMAVIFWLHWMVVKLSGYPQPHPSTWSTRATIRYYPIRRHGIPSHANYSGRTKFGLRCLW